MCRSERAEGPRPRILLSNLRGTESDIPLVIEHLPWHAPTHWRILLVDEKRNLEQVAEGMAAEGRVVLDCHLPAPGLLLVELEADRSPADATGNQPTRPHSRPVAATIKEQSTAKSRLRLLPPKNVRIDSPFWSPKLDVYRQQTIPHSWQYMQWELRALQAAAGESVDGDLNGTWGEANLYKFFETCAYSLAQFPDPALARRWDAIVELLGRAQRPDGYLHAYVTNNHKQPWDPEFLDGSHDGYVLGHMIEAAIEYHAATGKDEFLRIARRAADQAYQHFLGPAGVPGFGGHAELEMALVELYRVTGESRYLDLARAFVEWRGHGLVKPHSDTPRAYFQDAFPLREQKTLEGHAVRAIFFATGVADLALETGDPDYRLAANRFWNSTARRRMTVTGSIGPRRSMKHLVKILSCRRTATMNRVPHAAWPISLNVCFCSNGAANMRTYWNESSITPCCMESHWTAGVPTTGTR